MPRSCSRWPFLPVLATFAAFFLPIATARAAEPTLTIKTQAQTTTITRQAMLARRDVTTVEVPSDPAYPGKTMTYKAVPAAALFDGLSVPADAVIQFRCLDGFSAPISRARLLSRAPDQSMAYVAIEPAQQPWPPLKPGAPSAGPFYLIWLRPELSFISPEEWPFQLAAFEVKGSLAEVYPAILPDGPGARLAANAPARLGFGVFTRNCFACHTLNKSGAATVGPDLNVPMSPTEYLTPLALRRLIRDPQSVRHFPKSRMSAFPPAVLSERDLDHLVAYLEHMAKRRPTK